MSTFCRVYLKKLFGHMGIPYKEYTMRPYSGLCVFKESVFMCKVYLCRVYLKTLFEPMFIQVRRVSTNIAKHIMVDKKALPLGM